MCNVTNWIAKINVGMYVSNIFLLSVLLDVLWVSSCGRVHKQFKNLSHKNMTAAFFSCKCNYYVAVVWRETAVNTEFPEIRSAYAFMSEAEWKVANFLRCSKTNVTFTFRMRGGNDVTSDVNPRIVLVHGVVNNSRA